MKHQTIKPLISGRGRQNRLLYDFRELPPIAPKKECENEVMKEVKLGHNLQSKSTFELTDDLLRDLSDASQLEDADLDMFYHAFL